MLPDKNTDGADPTGQPQVGTDPSAREAPKQALDGATGCGHLAKRSDLASARAKHGLPAKFSSSTTRRWTPSG